MATLAQRIADVVTAIGQDIKALFIRAVPVGGVTGQVLTKASDDDHDMAWTTIAGGGGAMPIVVSTFLNVTPAKFDLAEIETPNGSVVSTSLIVANLVKSDEFDLDDLADVQIKAEALTGAIRFTLFSEILVGNYLIAYQVFN
jgi:hypothetical protein